MTNSTPEKLQNKPVPVARPPDPKSLGFEYVDTIDFNRGPAAPASWQVPDPSRLDDFIHTLQDKNVDDRHRPADHAAPEDRHG